jgi:hypothetical protein
MVACTSAQCWVEFLADLHEEEPSFGSVRFDSAEYSQQNSPRCFATARTVHHSTSVAMDFPKDPQVDFPYYSGKNPEFYKFEAKNDRGIKFIPRERSENIVENNLFRIGKMLR